jgi:hypothetical protein
VKLANCHIHLPPNFSAFSSVEQAVDLAAQDGIDVLGASNYYDHRIYRPFASACASRGILPLFGIEIVCWNQDAALKGHKINDPGNPGKMYLCGKALRRLEDPTPRAAELLALVRERDHRRMHSMAGLLSQVCLEANIAVSLEASEVEREVAQRSGVEPEAVTLQERHLAQALQEALFSAVSPDQRLEVFSRLYGATAKSSTDPVAVQSEIRTHLMKAGKPAYSEEAFISLSEALDLIHALEGIASYPVVMDGMSPLSEFESSPSILASQLKGLGIEWVEFIPNRNSPGVVRETVSCLVDQGFRVTAGTEHNTQEMIPLRPLCRGGEAVPEEAELHFLEGARTLLDWQYGPSAGGKKS